MTENVRNSPKLLDRYDILKISYPVRIELVFQCRISEPEPCAPRGPSHEIRKSALRTAGLYLSSW